MDEWRSLKDLAAAGVRRAVVGRIVRMIKGSEFKRRLPPIAKLSPRSVGHDFLYPVGREG